MFNYSVYLAARGSVMIQLCNREKKLIIVDMLLGKMRIHLL